MQKTSKRPRHAYTDALRAAAGEPPVLDLVLLGLGPDGHTASLVPGDPSLEVTDADVAIAGPYQGRRRMTLTYPVIDRARRVLWVVTGAEKSDMLRRLRDGDREIPAGRVRQDRALVFADRAAGGRMTGPGSMNLRIPSMPNFRDAGGYRAAGGATMRAGLLYRSDHIPELSPADTAALVSLGIKVVYDLRTEAERTMLPGERIPGAIHVPLDLMADDRQAAPAQLLRLLEHPRAAQALLGNGKAEALFVGGYRSVVTLAERTRGAWQTVRRARGGGQPAGTLSLHHGQGPHGLDLRRVADAARRTVRSKSCRIS